MAQVTLWRFGLGGGGGAISMLSFELMQVLHRKIYDLSKASIAQIQGAVFPETWVISSMFMENVLAE